MNEFVFLAFITAALIAVILLKKYDGVLGMVLSLTAAVLILTECMSGFEEISVKLNGFTLSSELFDIPVKALGITVFSRIVTSLCEDAGEKLLGFTVAFLTKLSIVILTLPLIEEILTILNDIAER